MHRKITGGGLFVMLLTMMVVLHQGTYLATVLHCCCWLLHGCLGWWQYQWSNQKCKWSLLALEALTQSSPCMVELLMVNFASVPWEWKLAFISDCFIWAVMIFTDNGTSRNENRVFLLSGHWHKVHHCHEGDFCWWELCACGQHLAHTATTTMYINLFCYSI